MPDASVRRRCGPGRPEEEAGTRASVRLDPVQWIARARDHAVRVESFLAITTRAEPLRAALLARCDLLLQVAGDK